MFHMFITIVLEFPRTQMSESEASLLLIEKRIPLNEIMQMCSTDVVKINKKLLHLLFHLLLLSRTSGDFFLSGGKSSHFFDAAFFRWPKICLLTLSCEEVRRSRPKIRVIGGLTLFE